MTGSSCGYVAILGRPNVGKSTLLNHVLGQKVSITSRKPQTTRRNLVGVLTRGQRQALFIDTPGYHTNTRKKAINNYMNEAALAALRDVDLVLLVLDRDRLTDAEDRLIEAVRRSGARAWLVINKVDRLQARELDKGQWSRLASVMDVCERTWEISAKHGHGLDDLVEGILSVMPSGPMMFPEEMTTDQPLSMQISEAIREKLVRQLGDELPYETAVVVEQIGDEEGVLHVDAVIYVERDAQKGIVIGRQGTRLKKIGQDARHDIEKMTGQKVMLNLWVKIKSNWSDDLKSLRGFGYDDRDI